MWSEITNISIKHVPITLTPDLCLFEVFQECEFLGEEHEEGVASAPRPGGATHPVDVLLKR